MSAKIGIALGGGGARGLAHLGVLKTFEAEGIPIHYIAGSSIGSVIAAMYAQNPRAEELIEKSKALLNQDLYDEFDLDYFSSGARSEDSLFNRITKNIKKRIALNMAQSREAILKDVNLRDVIAMFVEEGNIQDTKIPLGIAATCLGTGENVLFTEGDILTACTASSSIPGYFVPVHAGGRVLVDGGVGCPVPVGFLREMGAEITIGVEIGMREHRSLETLNVIEIVAQAETITYENLAGMMLASADVAIYPDTSDITWYEFSRADGLVEKGMKSAEQSLPAIRGAVRRKSAWYRGILPTGH